MFPGGVGCKRVSVIFQELLNNPSFRASRSEDPESGAFDTADCHLRAIRPAGVATEYLKGIILNFPKLTEALTGLCRRVSLRAEKG